jgi:hypothetical protein
MLCATNEEIDDPKHPPQFLEVEELCDRCRAHIAVVTTIGGQCDFNSAEAAAFVHELPAGSAGAILGAIAMKMIRSWGAERAREIILQKIDWSIEAVGKLPNDG